MSKIAKKDLLEKYLSNENSSNIGPKDKETFDTFLNNVADLIKSLCDPISTVDESYNDVEYKQEYNALCKLLVYSFPFCCVVPVDPDTHLFITDSDKFEYYIYAVPIFEDTEWNLELLPRMKFEILVGRLRTEIGKNRIESCVTGNEKQFVIIRNKKTGKYSSAENVCGWCGKSIDNSFSTVEFNNRQYCNDRCKRRAVRLLDDINKILDTWIKYKKMVDAGKQSEADELKNNGIYSCCINVENTIEKEIIKIENNEIKKQKKVLTYKRHIDPYAIAKLYSICGPSAELENLIYGRYCQYCGKPLPPDKNRGAKYCSNACRYNAADDRKKEKKE